MSETPTPDDGALTLDQAVEALAPAADAAVEDSDGAGDGLDPQEEGLPSVDPEVSDAVALDPLEAPLYWSREAKARFAELPSDLQAVVLSQEGPREEAAAKAKAEAADEVGRAAELAEALAERLPQWLAAFESRWGASPPDWMAIAQEHGAEAASVAKAQYDAERAQLVEAEQAREAADSHAHEHYVRSEFAKLQAVAPHLADPERGPAARAEISRYLVASGVDPGDLVNISAAELSLAHKALLWDRTRAAMTAGKTKPPAPARAPVRPAAGSAQSPHSRTAHGAQARFQAKPSLANAVDLLMSRQGNR